MSVRVMSMVYAAHFQDIAFMHKGKKKVTGEEYEKKITVLNSNLKAVCLALADHANDEGEGSYPAIDSLCEKTELSEVTVVACLTAMKQEQIISYTGRSKWNTCNYTINKGKISEMASWERQKRARPGSGETKATLVLKLKPLKLETKATLVKPSIHPKPSFNDDESKRQAEILAIAGRTESLRKLYEANVGPITPLMMNFLKGAAIDYPDENWYEPAFAIMVASAKHRNWNFVDTVLKGWKENYFGWKPEFNKNEKGVKHGAKSNGKDNHSGSKSTGLSAAGQRAADEINKQRAAKKAAGLSTV